MKITQRVGVYELEAWTDGYPEWVSLTKFDHAGSVDDVLRNIHPDDLPDMVYMFERLAMKLADSRKKLS